MSRFYAVIGHLENYDNDVAMYECDSAERAGELFVAEMRELWRGDNPDEDESECPAVYVDCVVSSATPISYEES